jgi:hypothetical protein
MFPTAHWRISLSLGWQFPPTHHPKAGFWRIFGIGTALEWRCSSIRKPIHGSKKGEFEMSSSYRTLIAMAAALLMSIVTVGAAVGPAQANANPIQVSVNA